MKRVLFSVAVLAASVCAADEIYSSNVLGVLPVNSVATRTIVSVPWCAISASDNESIQASNIVKTANLTVGDTLHIYQGTSFQSWRLADNGGVHYWESVNQVGEDGVPTETPSAAAIAAARGTALILIRQNATNENGTAKTFYLYGQVGSGSVTTEITARGSSTAPVYTLVAPAGVAGADLCATGVSNNIAEGDEIYISSAIGAQVQYTYKDGAWSRYKYASGGWSWVKATSINVPAGTGFWYVSKSSDGSNPVFNW